MANSSIFFDLFARDRNVSSTLDNIGNKAKHADTNLHGAAGGLGKLVAPATTALAAVGGVAFSFGQMAAEAEQNTGAVETVFGKAASKVEEFSKRSAQAVGLTASDYNALSATTGTALKSAGVSFDQLAEKNDMLITRGADLASVFGGTTSDAVQAMGSAFRGEFDPLERYGVTLHMGAVNARMAADGTDKLTGAAKETAKKQTILKIIMEQSAGAAGNFAREADTTAGAQSRATAAFGDASAKLGEKLLPALTGLADMLAAAATWISDNSELVTALAGTFALLAGGVVVASVIVGGGIGAIVLAIAGLVIAIGLIAANWDQICKFIADRWTDLTRWWNDGMSKLGEQWNNFWRDVNTKARSQWDAIIAFIQQLWDGLVRWWNDGMRRVSDQWSGFWGGINTKARQQFNAVGTFVRSLWTGLTTWWAQGMRRIGDQWNGFWGGVGSNLRRVYNATLKPVFDTISRIIKTNIPEAFKAGVGLVKSHWNKIEGIAKAPISFLINKVINDGLFGAFNTVSEWLKLGVKLGPLRIAGFRSGGYTGDGDPSEVAGAVHKGEYVLDAPTTKALGLNYAGAPMPGSLPFIQGALQAEIRASRALKLVPLGAYPMRDLMTAAYAWNGLGGVSVGVGNLHNSQGPHNGLSPATVSVAYGNLGSSILGFYAGRNIMMNYNNPLQHETIIHEVGHALGLHHNTGNYSIMHPMLRGGGARWPTPYDAANLRILYGSGPGGKVEGIGGGNPIADIVDGVINGLKNAFKGNIVADLAVGVGRKLFDVVGDHVMGKMGMPQFDDGGWFEKGFGFHGKSTPDAVLSKEQWSDIHSLARQGGAMTVYVQSPWDGSYMEAKMVRVLRQNAEDLSYRRPGE